MYYFEIDFNNGYGMCIKSRLPCPTWEQIEKFCKKDIKNNGGMLSFLPIERKDAEKFYDFSNEKYWPILDI